MTKERLLCCLGFGHVWDKTKKPTLRCVHCGHVEENE